MKEAAEDACFLASFWGYMGLALAMAVWEGRDFCGKSTPVLD